MLGVGIEVKQHAVNTNTLGGVITGAGTRHGIEQGEIADILSAIAFAVEHILGYIDNQLRGTVAPPGIPAALPAFRVSDKGGEILPHTPAQIFRTDRLDNAFPLGTELLL